MLDLVIRAWLLGVIVSPIVLASADHEWPASSMEFSVPYTRNGAESTASVSIKAKGGLTQVTLKILGKNLIVPSEDLGIVKDPIINRTRLMFGTYYAFYLKGFGSEVKSLKPNGFLLEIEYGTMEMHDLAEGRAKKTITFVFSDKKYLGYTLSTYDGKGGSGSTMLLTNKADSNANFQKLIKGATRVVVSRGGDVLKGSKRDTPESTLKKGVVLEINDQKEIKKLAKNTVFQKVTTRNSSLFSLDHSGIDWYVGDKRVATTACEHGLGRMHEGTIMFLTSESNAWMNKWFKKHGMTEEQLK